MVSVVLPTYNEAPTIGEFLRAVIEAAVFFDQPYEILVLDDNSPDGTAAVIEREFTGVDAVRVVRRTGARGLGVSVREGVERSRGDIVVIMDADFNHDPRVVPYMVRLLDVFDLVVGSRFAPNGGMPEEYRHFGSFGVNLVLRVVLRTQIQDNLSGFLAIRRPCLERLPFDRIFWGYGDFCFRLLFFALRVPLKIIEMPVVYGRRRGGSSKTSLAKTTARYLFEIVRLRVSYWNDPTPPTLPLFFQYDWPPVPPRPGVGGEQDVSEPRVE